MPNSTLIVKYALFHNVDFPIVKLRMNWKDFGMGEIGKKELLRVSILKLNHLM